MPFPGDVSAVHTRLNDELAMLGFHSKESTCSGIQKAALKKLKRMSYICNQGRIFTW